MAATYVLPQVRLFQDLRQNVSVDARKATAFIFGGHAALYRYSKADEKLLIFIGTYDSVGANVGGEWKTCYSWPEKPVGSQIDESYTKLFIDKATLRYFTDVGHTMVKKTSNTIRHPTKNFATNGSFAHHADFLDRGVKIGDLIKVKATVDDEDYELFTYVKGFKGDAVAAVTGTAAANTANQATAGATTTFSADDDNTGVADITSVSGASYHGFEDGDVQETYTIEVIQASTGGDHTTALLRITSASGNDDVSSKVPSAATYSTAIGTRGATATFGAGAFAVGDIWTFFVREAWTKTVPTASGTYTGTKDLTYIATVTSGGESGGDPEPSITVTTIDGSDFSGPTVVPTAADTSVAIGRYGVLMSFSTAKLRKGDRFEVSVTAATEGAYKTLVLGHSLSDEIDVDDDTVDMEIALYIKKDIQVGLHSVNVDGEVNWSQSNTQFCAMADIYAYDDTWTDDGDPVALPVINDSVSTGYNKLYLEYRAWRSSLSTSVSTLNDVADLDTIPGPLTPDNPLKWAMYKALSNNNGQDVRYCAVTDPDDIDTWGDVLDLIEDRPDVYGLVPLTWDEEVLNLVQAHCQSQSDENHKRYRVLWSNVLETLTELVLDATTSSDEEVVLATTEDDSDTTGTQYTIFRITSANADLIELGVRAGDTARFQFSADAWDEVSYNSYVIDEVLTEDTFRVVSGTTSAENVGIKLEIYRSLDKNEQAAAIGAKSGNYADRRVRSVWPDEVGEAGTLMPGYHLCAALAAYAGGVVQNQGLTNAELNGFDDLSKTLKFNRSQLDTMAVNGTWIVTQDRESGEVYTRHAVTTGDYEDLNQREEMITRNLDLISFRFDDQFSPYIGKCNAVRGMIDILSAEFSAVVEELRRPITPTLGPVLIDAVITDLRISPLFRDRILLSATLTLPVSLNNIDFHELV